MSSGKTDPKVTKSEPGTEASEPSPESDREGDDANEMYKAAAKKLDDKGAADPKQAEKLVKDGSS